MRSPGREAGSRCEELLDAVLAADRDRAEEIVAQHVEAGWSADDVRLALITPTLTEVGERWARGELTVGDEHLATGVCDWLLSELAGWSRPPQRRRGTAVVACSEDELHALGARMLADMLRERGWRVLFLGAGTPSDALEAVVRARDPGLVAISTSRREGLAGAADAVRRVRAAAPGCELVVGGQAYDDADRDRELVGADRVELDVRELLERFDAAA